jgi:hypothetical protein
MPISANIDLQRLPFFCVLNLNSFAGSLALAFLKLSYVRCRAIPEMSDLP